MALARGTVIRPVDFNIPLLQFPFEAMYGQMQQFQQEKDQGDALSTLMPKYINPDAEDAVKFRDLTNKLAESTTQAFASGDTQRAVRTMREAQSEIKKQWQPGGLANALQSRYDQYNTAVKDIAEGTKSNKSDVYGRYFKNQLEQSVGKGSGYDPVTGAYRSIAAPQLSKEVILGDEVDSFLKGWAADKGVEITKSADGMWYNKVTQEKVDPNELKGALAQFYQQPHIQQALGVYGWDRAQGIDAEKARTAYSQKLMGDLDAQGAQLAGLQDQLTKGNKRQIAELQKDLNEQGYNLSVDGVAGPKTKAAVDDYIASAREEQEKLRAQIPGQLANIDATQFAVEDLKNELTNTYVPKYAYTKRDIDMIANQPAIAQMRIRAQQSAMAGLKAMLFAPTNTLIAPVATNPMTVGTISQQYGESKKNYKELESAVMQNLTPEMKNIFTRYGADAYRSSNVLFNAAQSAMKSGKYDPAAFKKSLRQQGITLSDAELDKQAMMMASPNNRSIVSGLYDQLQPAAQGMKVAEEMFNQYRDKALASDKIDWTAVARQGGFGSYSGGGSGGFGASSTSGTFSPNIEAVKKAYASGDPKAMALVNAQVAKMSVKDQSQMFQGESAVNLVLNEKLKPFEKQLLDLSQMNMAAVVDYKTMDKSQLAQLGLDKKGNVLRDENGKPKIKIESANIGTTVVNGKSSTVILMKTSGMQAPIALPMTALNAQWASTLVNNITATGIDPNNPSNVIDQGTVDAGSVLRYDLDQDEGTGFNAEMIYQRMNQPGSVGTSFLRTDQGTVELQTFVVQDKLGSGNYLVTTSSDSEADQLRKNPKTDISRYQKTDTSHAVKLAGGYQGVNNAILSTKAELYRGQVLTEAYREPFNVTRQPSNLTANPGVLMGALEAMNFDY